MRYDPWVPSELLARLRWFVRLRWLAVVGVAASILILHWLAGVALPLETLLLVVAALAVVNALYWLQLRTADPGLISARSVLLTTNVQIAVDLLFVTLLLHFLGGVENPFYLYYVFHIVIASILLPPLATYLQATLAVILFGCLTTLEFSGLIPHFAVDLLGIDGAYREVGYVLAVLTAFASTMYLAAYLATSIVGRLRERERQVFALGNRLQAEQDDLRRAYRQLQGTEEAKSRHMRRVGHQLRSPLVAVQTLLSTLLDEAAEPLSEQLKDVLARALSRTREMLRTVEDMLALSRASEARRAPAGRPVALDETIRRAAHLFAASAAAKSISLETSLLGPLPPLRGDPAGLDDLVVNLTANAIKYTPPGGTVRLSAALQGERIVIRVADTGIGIAPDELPRIFDEFYRSDRAMRMVREGTGLGLSIARAVVEAHGGSIAVESAPGEGTTFVVSLPLVGPGGGDLPSASSASDRPDGQDAGHSFHTDERALVQATPGGTQP